MKNNQQKENINKIFDELYKDSRQTIEQIANTTQLSRQTVGRLLRKMEDEKWIWGYCTVIDIMKMGFYPYVLLAKRKQSTDFHKTAKEFFDSWNGSLMKNVKILYSGMFHGEYDLVILFLARDLIQARQTVNIIFKNISDKIESYSLQEGILQIRTMGFFNPSLNNYVKKLY